jgi:DNA-binding NarL/FixJ family response regulator
LNKLSLFIAEDSELMCTRLAQILSEIEGTEILGFAFTVPDAFRYLNKIKPDIAILDICMPGGTGMDILKRIRKDGNRTKVIIYTHYPYPQYRKRCMQLGADYFFDKYTEFEKLFQVVKDLVRQRGAESAPS